MSDVFEDKIRSYCIDRLDRERQVLNRQCRIAGYDAAHKRERRLDRLDEISETEKLCGCYSGECKRYD